MIINEGARSRFVLQQTLAQEIVRLRLICSSQNLLHCENKVRLAQRDCVQQAYAQAQKQQEMRNRAIYREEQYFELMREKGQSDLELKRAVQINRNLLTELHAKRRQLAAKQTKVTRQRQQLEETMKELEGQEETENMRLKQLKQVRREIGSTQQAVEAAKSDIKLKQNMKTQIEKEINLEDVCLTAIKREVRDLQEQIASLRRQLVASAVQAEKQRTASITQLSKESQILSNMEKQKEKVGKDITLYEKSLEETGTNEKKVLERINSIQIQNRQIQNRIVENLKLLEEINSQCFSIKITKTEFSNRSKLLTERNLRLLSLKNDLWSMLND